MKILLTGAHFTPAQAVIEELISINNSSFQPGDGRLSNDQGNKPLEIVYVGRKTTREGDNSPSIESQILPKLGVKFISITTGRLQRSFSLFTIPSLLKIPVGIIQAFYILSTEKPDIIVSFGGYVALPLVLVGWLLSIPSIIHEQTLVSGLANKISAIFAKKIAITFEGSTKGNNVVVVGNPLRKELINEPKPTDEIKTFINKASNQKLPLIYITGGNQGSHVINQVVGEALGELLKKAFIIHQTGDSKFLDFDKLSEIKKNLAEEKYLIKKWVSVEDLSLILRKTDLCVSRAGVNTLYELAYFGIPTIAIPIPFLYQDEQTKNAKFFEKIGMVEIIAQKELSKKTLTDKIFQLIKNINSAKMKAKNSRNIVKVDAAKKMVLEIFSCI